MKAMVSEFDEPSDVATLQSSRTLIMEKQQVPPGWTIFIGNLNGPRWRMNYHRNSDKLGISKNGGPITAEESPLARNTYSITVGIGRLLIWALSINAKQIAYKPAAHVERYMSQIWPTRHDLLWPPGPILTDTAADAIADTLKGATANIPWTSNEGAGTPHGAP